ncbi:unnamed protein product [Acanthoscelides obtectus]|uniref:Uncharacterized protein n=1 Tax=Acanthoscelides obtectus TaxID=200917 RepID=A0A9P0PBI1_ACAOB|nr:unnamed protein product [Acanthoscelides obtectus]CAK1655842.1 hypothetical protein AOBTE_LOCUS19380 [Acanthoscelides obtectus]
MIAEKQVFRESGILTVAGIFILESVVFKKNPDLFQNPYFHHYSTRNTSNLISNTLTMTTPEEC